MTDTRKLYRVVKQHRYDGGRGCDRLHGETVLYCDYDRAEAIRVYHAERSNVNQGSGAGSYYQVVKATSKTVRV
jgi:hypothetical protein